MSPSTAQVSVARRRAAARRAAQRRRRAFLFVAVMGALALGVALLAPLFRTAVRDITLPLNHEADIRRQAADKRLDPALIAGVIFTESKFVDQTSPVGALGLMQLMPDTARFIAEKSGGTAFTIEDLSTPAVNIAYGSWYLRYLLDHYGGDETRALAAYNGGMGNVNRWIADAESRGETFSEEHIRFAETREYVDRVRDAKADYAATYPGELGISVR